MGTNLRRQDYREYHFSKKEFAGVMGVILLAMGVLAWTFYRSALALIPLSPLGYLIYRYMKEQRGEKQREELAEQFKECILSVSASVRAGYAVENAFMESREDMASLYGRESLIYMELEIMRRGLVINIPLEEQLMDFGVRSGVEDISGFAGMFAIAKRGGGSLTNMIKTSAEVISQKMEARQELAVLLSGKKMELNIMRGMPMAIVWYLGVTSPGFFDPLYHNFEGVMVMSLCLGVYLAAVLLGEKVFRNIEKELSGKVKKPEIPGLKPGKFDAFLRFGIVLYRKLEARNIRLPGKARVRHHLEILEETKDRDDIVESYYGGKFGLSILTMITGGCFGGITWLKNTMANQESRTFLMVWAVTLAASCLIFFLLDKDLADQVEKRKRNLRFAYPDILHRLSLYLVSGMTVRSAFGKLGEDNELAGFAYREMLSGGSEAEAYEHFGKRAGVHEYVKLGTLLAQNLKKGSGGLLARMEEEAADMVEKRVQNGRRLGEEAGTKLLIPMVMLLGVVMIMIMVPAFSGIAI